MSGFLLKRLGTIMEPETGNLQEVEGVLNPAAARGPDGELYLFPRLVAKGNYSRIGIARVKFDEAGDPFGVERLGIALEPEAEYELRPDGSGGCEDPRVTFLEPFNRYVMTYTAFSPNGPRIALAISEDLFHWERLGLASLAPMSGIALDNIDNKDASLFPHAIPGPLGRGEMAMLHRPLFPTTRPEETVCLPASRKLDMDKESIWISYSPSMMDSAGGSRLLQFTAHDRLASPVSDWERLKIGGGTPPIMTRHGWLIVYHGVSDLVRPDNKAHPLCYSAGVMVLSEENPQNILYRSPEPVLRPTVAAELDGTVADVVFPTGIDRRDDLGSPNRFDIYYGMADQRIGVARLDLPDVLPIEKIAHPPDAEV